MITWNNALTHVAEWCKANPGKPHFIPFRMLPQLGLDVITTAAWAKEQGLEYCARSDGETVTAPLPAAEIMPAQVVEMAAAMESGQPLWHGARFGKTLATRMANAHSVTTHDTPA